MKFGRGRRVAKQEAVQERFSLVTALRAAGATSTVLVHDLTSTGFEAECLAKLKRGTRVHINLSGLGDVDARIVATRRGVLTGQFVQPIDLAQYDGETGISAVGATEALLPKEVIWGNQPPARELGRDTGEAG